MNELINSAVIPAQPGFYLVGWNESAEGPKAYKIPIIAWTIQVWSSTTKNMPSRSEATPITAGDQDTSFTSIMRPDGSVFHLGLDELFDSLEKYVTGEALYTETRFRNGYDEDEWRTGIVRSSKAISPAQDGGSVAREEVGPFAALVSCPGA